MNSVKTFPLVVFVLGLAFVVLGLGIGHEGGMDLSEVLLGVLQALLAAIVLGWIPMPSKPATDGGDADQMNKH